jgi:hypothetical protein
LLLCNQMQEIKLNRSIKSSNRHHKMAKQNMYPSNYSWARWV